MARATPSMLFGTSIDEALGVIKVSSMFGLLPPEPTSSALADSTHLTTLLATPLSSAVATRPDLER